MKSHAKELGIRDNQLVVGGESAGAGLTAALTLYARDKAEVSKRAISFFLNSFKYAVDHYFAEQNTE